MPRKSRSRRYRGGAGAASPSSYSSASSYGVAVNGPSVEGQFDRTFMGTGPATYRGVQGQMTGGRRRSRGRRGGFLGAMGSVINQAIVPFSILGMQQTYKRGKHGGRRTRRHRR
jgi:hypothetical protein